MAKKTVIAGSNNVTAKQLKEVMNQIDQGTITGGIVQNLLDHAKNFEVKPLDLHQRFPSVLLLVKNGVKNCVVKKEMTQEDFTLEYSDFWPWKDVIMHAASCARIYFQRLDHESFKSYIEYHQVCWKKIDEAKDDHELVDAVAFLGITMQKWQTKYFN